jgi:hypothetical protein
MFKIIAAGLVAAAVLAAPVAGALAASTAPTVHKTKVVKAKPFALKTARLHRHRIGDPRHVRIVNANVKHARVHAPPRVRIGARHGTAVRHAHVPVRKHPQPATTAVKPVKTIKTVKQLRQAKPGRTG